MLRGLGLYRMPLHPLLRLLVTIRLRGLRRISGVVGRFCFELFW